MKEFPHVYFATATGSESGTIPTSAPGVEDLETNAPPEFGGPEGFWSPETMLTGSVANCFILTFRAISRKAGLAWKNLDVNVEGTLEKTPEGLRFTRFLIKAALSVNEMDAGTAHPLLETAKQHCLVTASLNATVELEAEIRS